MRDFLANVLGYAYFSNILIGYSKFSTNQDV